MKVLIVCSKNSGRIAPFITDQVEALQKAGVICEYFTIEGKGIIGYLLNFVPLWRKIRAYKPDLLHAHYGLSGVLANLQRKVPVVTTYHGSDINNPRVRRFSKIAIHFSAWNIFVSQKNIQLAGVKKYYSLIPCGVDTTLFCPTDKQEARKRLGFAQDEQLILFAGTFDNKVKNPELAKEAVKKLPGARLLELKGYSRTQVAELMNAVDICLMTSHTEGSPQFVKEALACNCPIVSVNVGDVEELLLGVENCRIVERDADKIAEMLNEILNSPVRSTGNRKIKDTGLDSNSISEKLLLVYKQIF